jgi:lysophospholipase L1-like esterase
MAWGRWGQIKAARAPGSGRMGMASNLRYQTLLQDDFTADLAAGALTGTLATDGVNVRTVPLDTALRVQTTGGKLYFNNGAAWNNPGVYYPEIGRYPGVTMIGMVDKPAAGGLCQFGFSDVISGVPGGDNPHLFYSSAGDIQSSGDSTGISNIIYVPNASVPASYKFAITMRRRAAFLFLNLGSTWKMVFRSVYSLANALRPAAVGNNSKPYFDTLRVVSGFMPIPVASDGFSGTWPTTDGKGHREGQAGEIGAGGSGRTWTAQVGTWGAAAGVASASALDGGIALATVDAGTPDINASMRVSARTGNVGLVFRYIDAQNYAYAYYNGTSITIRQVVAGVDSEVAAPVVTTWANNTLAVLHVDGVSVRLLWCNSGDSWSKTCAGTLDASLTGTKVGLYVDNTATTIDTFDVYALGTEGQYANLDRYLVGSGSPQPLQVVKNLLYFGDSKTAGSADESKCNGYPAYMTTLRTICKEIPTRIAVGEATVASRKATIDADLAAATGTPEYVLWNLGANDAAALPTEVQFKADAQYMIDAFRAKWATTPIYITMVWRASAAANCDIINGWYGDVIAANPGVCFAGPDERITLKGTDNGATYTADLLHPNALGYCQRVAPAWRSILGLA